jgi:hypothetical protein
MPPLVAQHLLHRLDLDGVIRQHRQFAALAIPLDPRWGRRVNGGYDVLSMEEGDRQEDCQAHTPKLRDNVLVAIRIASCAAKTERVPGARIVELPGANHYELLSNEADVLQEINSFIAHLPSRNR